MLRVSPIARGGWIALFAAIAFGVTTPLVKRAGYDVGALTTASLLYLGAALASVTSLFARGDREAPLRVANAGRLVAVAFCGGAIAPALLAWGLQRTSASSASLLLNFEAVFTVGLARVFYREPIGARVWVAMIVIASGGALLVLDGAHASAAALWGSIAVAAATLAWALDNALTRPLADVNPAQVVFWKGAIGAGATFVVACILHETPPSLGHAAALVACGATGYGLSLRLYLRAQRSLGAARTGSIFAVAPFVGAVVALALGEGEATAETAIAGVLLATGIALHLTEKHHHEHIHDAIEHEHAHRHDDGHHEHRHSHPEEIRGEHSHLHRHDRMIHDHDHAPDMHHDHRHD